MFITCQNKGCYASEESVLDENDNTVYCLRCQKPIEVPRQTKVTLKTLKQTKRTVVKKGLQFTCKECKATNRPELKTLAGKVTIAICPKCSKEMKIPAPFIEALKSIAPDESDEEADEAKPAQAGQPTPKAKVVKNVGKAGET